jgi:hypothetical protein
MGLLKSYLCSYRDLRTVRHDGLPLVELGWPDHGLGLDPGVEGGDPLQDSLRLHFNLCQDTKDYP